MSPMEYQDAIDGWPVETIPPVPQALADHPPLPHSQRAIFTWPVHQCSTAGYWAFSIFSRCNNEKIDPRQTFYPQEKDVKTM